MNQKDSGILTKEKIRSIWILTDGKPGDEMQCVGVAEALGVPFQRKHVAPQAPFVWLMPWGPIDPRDLAPSKSAIAAPFPDIVIASGRKTVPYLRYIRKASAKRSPARTFTVFLKNPRLGRRAIDLIWAPAHDRLSGDKVISTITSPHPYSPERLSQARAYPSPEIAALSAPRVAVLLGGDSRHHRFTPEDVARFAQGLERIVDAGARLMITSSRRTPPALLAALRPIEKTGRHLFWRSGEKNRDNPIVQFLANADHIVVTADSTNMISEAAATGKPLYIFEPCGGHPKIDAFLEALRKNNVTSPFPGPLEGITYEPIDSTLDVARAIRENWMGHCKRQAEEKTHGERTS